MWAAPGGSSVGHPPRLPAAPPKNLSIMSAGGLSPPQPATPEIQGFADQVRPQLEEATNKTFAKYKAFLYRQQVVAGMNYFVKMQCGDREKDYIHLRIYQGLLVKDGQVELSGFQVDKTKDDPIVYF